MKLILLYGPPSAGKYTIGKALAERTGYKFFHNHLTVEAVRPIFDDSDERRVELLCDLRARVIKAAAWSDQNTIFTLAYSGVVDDDFITRLVDIVKKYGGTVKFVQLYAPPKTLMDRIENESRKLLGKASTQASLQKSLATRDHYATVKYPADNFRIDTTQQSPDQSAQLIIEHFELLPL